MDPQKILILDSDPASLHSLAEPFRQCGCQVQTVSSPGAAQAQLAQGRFDLVLADVRFLQGTGPDLSRQGLEAFGSPALVLAAELGSAEAGLAGLDAGACDLLFKPVSACQVQASLHKARSHGRLLQLNHTLSHSLARVEEQPLLGVSPAMVHLRQLLRKVALTHATVLVHGESGTGKHYVARELFRQSARAHAPFLPFNCAAQDPQLVEAVLFGEEKASGTGPSSIRRGLLELLDGGTLLLEEVTQLPAPAQQRLLGWLQTQQCERVGGRHSFRVDVRLLVTTNRPLEEMAQQGEFSEELFYRLNVVPVHVPPLRQRQEDVPVLAEHFRQSLSQQHGLQILAISPAACRALQAQPWPGNVRELHSALTCAMLRHAQVGILEPHHFGLSNPDPAASHGETPGQRGANPVPDSLHEVEKRHIFTVLDHCRGNRTHAARILGISIRTLRNKLREYRTAAVAETQTALVPSPAASLDAAA